MFTAARAHCAQVLMAVKRRFGTSTLVHFEDLTHANSSRLLAQYRGDFPCFWCVKATHGAVAAMAVKSRQHAYPKDACVQYDCRLRRGPPVPLKAAHVIVLVQLAGRVRLSVKKARLISGTCCQAHLQIQDCCCNKRP